MAEEKDEQSSRAEQQTSRQERGARRSNPSRQSTAQVDRGDHDPSGQYTQRSTPRRRPGIVIPPPNQIDYKNIELLQHFLSDRGKIKARRKTGANATQQRRIAQAIKRARHLALLPFTSEYIHGEY